MLKTSGRVLLEKEYPEALVIGRVKVRSHLLTPLKRRRFLKCPEVCYGYVRLSAEWEIYLVPK